MSQESSSQNNSQSKPASSQKPSRPKVNPNQTINYRQDGADKRRKRG